MTPAVAFRLGRVSNLPTVWTNALAGVVLAGGESWALPTLLAAIGLSLLYVSGMYLNDAFDRDIDAKERPGRPIPAGLVAADTVFFAGFAIMLAGLVVTLWGAAVSSSTTWQAMLSAIALAAAILFYDWHHKGNPLSPFFMGLCRVLAYLTAGYAAVAAPSPSLLVAALVCLSYLIGLTYIAKLESLDRIDRLWPLLFLAAPVIYGLVHFADGGIAGVLLLAALTFWILLALYFLNRRAKGDVQRAVIGLIAGISLVDALFLATAGSIAASMFALACFALTLALQRWVSGT
jgi:heme O synthase-like polyprenyltransferase